jgi:hypothetical protein
MRLTERFSIRLQLYKRDRRLVPEQLAKGRLDLPDRA